MEDAIIALISALVECFGELFSWLGCWYAPWDADILVNTEVMLSLTCLCLGGAGGWLSVLVAKHALLPKAALRIAALLTTPPAVGYGSSRRLEPAMSLGDRLTTRAFWLPLWFCLAFLAMRLLHLSR